MKPEEIRQLREDLDLSQQELASIVGVAQPAVLAWENGQYRPGEHKVAMMRKLRQRAKSDGQEFVERLLAVAGTVGVFVVLSKLFGGEG